MQQNESDTIITQSVLVPKPPKNAWAGIRKRLVRDRNLYLMLLPVIGFYLLFKLAPLGGEIIAFKNYRFADGIWGSDWVGLKHFESLFASKEFYMVLKNTLLLNVYSLLFGFPAPIILALLLNEVRVEWYKRIVQNFLYLPHFISWVVLGGILITILSPARGVINSILTKGLGLDPIYFLGDTFWWPITFVLSGIWREAGWGTILYLAAMANVDPQLYEAAKMDGAGKLRQIWHITLPGIRSTVAILLILKVGHMMDIGFEQIFVLQNDMVLGISDVISTYVYRIGLLSAQYSYTTALGLFQSLIALILVISVNKIVKLLGEKGLW
ncbi:ABC transporter permease [Paenibacillus radicis (ex Xue et al. 2023)]|uniref:ABC transporter permease subunit n=1 Tax=Paenibacillus radicis (ex Xue et al. 2023) TaxID=2972489 RepID=A0ABT1YJV1_9BACL|nr:ABC transporter permease subunit [Paenibacillus radicis (ex Xue et al. 2023)]MCR8632699.1 ABC transporter permease subunit [Paenibacillus radicis (ex Xue et al. 2023)]